MKLIVVSTVFAVFLLLGVKEGAAELQCYVCTSKHCGTQSLKACDPQHDTCVAIYGSLHTPQNPRVLGKKCSWKASCVALQDNYIGKVTCCTDSGCNI
ncbi:hypothetical protein XENTR_v10023656 [Xenopus tropicalis]|nr:hypothetical protein XENTR_v10023656 [Xenopus tropicalis]